MYCFQKDVYYANTIISLQLYNMIFDFIQQYNKIENLTSFQYLVNTIQNNDTINTNKNNCIIVLKEL